MNTIYAYVLHHFIIGCGAHYVKCGTQLEFPQNLQKLDHFVDMLFLNLEFKDFGSNVMYWDNCINIVHESKTFDTFN